MLPEAMSVLELRGSVSKVYRQGTAEVTRCAGVSLCFQVRVGRDGGGDEPQRVGQVHLLTIAGSLEDLPGGDVLVGGADLAGLPQGEEGPAAAPRNKIVVMCSRISTCCRAGAVEKVALPLESEQAIAIRRARAAGTSSAKRAEGLARRGRPVPGRAVRRRTAAGGDRRALVGDRQLVLADKPSGALDSVNAEEVMQLLHQACRAGRGRGGGDPRRAARLLGRPGDVPARRAGDRGGQPPGRSRCSRRGSGRGTAQCHAPGEPPDLAGAGHGSLVARRAVIRWAWRTVPRASGGSEILVMALLAVAVAGTIVGVARGGERARRPNAATHGTASSALLLPGADPHLAANLVAIRQQQATGPVEGDREQGGRRCSCVATSRPAGARPRTAATAARC